MGQVWSLVGFYSSLISNLIWHRLSRLVASCPLAMIQPNLSIGPSIPCAFSFWTSLLWGTLEIKEYSIGTTLLHRYNIGFIGFI